MAAYLTLVEFKARTAMPASFIDVLETQQPGFVAQQLELESARLDARLRKRYAAPFASPVPIVVLAWLTDIVTLRCWIRRGFSPTDEEAAVYVSNATTSANEVKEAADSVEGLFDLPLRQDLTASGIAKGGPRSYSEQSPYVWRQQQRCTGRNEDRSGRGTTKR